MENVSKIRRSISIKLGILSITLCLIIGLVMDMRPLVILERAFISYIASAMLGYIIVSAMGRFATSRKRVPLSSAEAVRQPPAPLTDAASPATRKKKEEDAL